MFDLFNNKVNLPNTVEQNYIQNIQDKEYNIEFENVKFNTSDEFQNIDANNLFTTESQNIETETDIVENRDVENSDIDNIDKNLTDDIDNIDDELEYDEDDFESDENSLFIISINDTPYFHDKDLFVTRKNLLNIGRKLILKNKNHLFDTLYIHEKSKNEIDIVQSMEFLLFSYNFVKYNIKIHCVNMYTEN